MSTFRWLPVPLFRQTVVRPTVVALLLVVGSACTPASEGAAQSEQATDPRSDGGLLGSVMGGLRPDQRDAAPTDSGPNVRVEFRADSVRLVMDAKAGDQLNALQPPVLELADGRRLSFQGSAITADSAYFVGDVSLMLPRDIAPTQATLHTSYCRSGERLCRSVSRTVQIAERAGD